MKKLFNLTYIIILLLTSSVFAEDNPKQERIYEYVIALIPEEKITSLAQALNKEIGDNLPDFSNIKNNWHISLYQGAFEKSEIDKIKTAISQLNPKKFSFKSADFCDSQNRWVNWNITKNDELQKIHEDIVKISSPFHKRMLKRVRYLYKDLSETDKKQVNSYGMTGVMETYKPHISLFYKYPADAELSKIPDVIKNDKYKNIEAKAIRIVIARMGYSGNITKIIDSVDLK